MVIHKVKVGAEISTRRLYQHFGTEELWIDDWRRSDTPSADAQAARFQIIVMVLSITCSMLASLAAVVCVLLVSIDRQHCLRADKLIARPWDRDAGVAYWVHAQAIKVRL